MVWGEVVWGGKESKLGSQFHLPKQEPVIGNSQVQNLCCIEIFMSLLVLNTKVNKVSSAPGLC